MNIAPPPRADGRAKDGPPIDDPSRVPCTPNVDCTNDFIIVNHTNSGSCTGPIGEQGSQYEVPHGVCHRQVDTYREFNVRWSCYSSEILKETFAYGCDGIPLWSDSLTIDKSISSASLAITKCFNGSPMQACRNPVNNPIPSTPATQPAPTGNSAAVSPALILFALAALVPLMVL